MCNKKTGAAKASARKLLPLREATWGDLIDKPILIFICRAAEKILSNRAILSFDGQWKRGGRTEEFGSIICACAECI